VSLPWALSIPPVGVSLMGMRALAVGMMGLFALAGCDVGEARAERVDLSVSSPAFEPGADVPREHTCDGADRSPRLLWSGAPSGTRSFVLAVTDPDAPEPPLTHWVAWDLPPQSGELEAGVPPGPTLPGGGRQGINGFGSLGYRGPCPPHGARHRYLFRVYALDTMLGLESGASRQAVEQAMDGHVLGRGELMGRYVRAETTRGPGSSPPPPSR